MDFNPNKVNQEIPTVETIHNMLTTKKQKESEYDFCRSIEDHEVWDEIPWGRTGPAYRPYTIEMEDVLYFNNAICDDNPMFNDQVWCQKNSPWGRVICHPIFIVAIQMYCTIKGPASWLRNPGAMNPGQKMKIYEPFFVGETINLVVKLIDRYQRGSRFYLGEQIDYYNQDGKLKATRWFRLTTPKTRDDCRARIKY